MTKTILVCGMLAVFASPAAMAGEPGSKAISHHVAKSVPTEIDGNDLAVDELLKIAFVKFAAAMDGWSKRTP